MDKRFKRSALALAIAGSLTLLTACNDDDNNTTAATDDPAAPASTTTITGVAETLGGQVALLENRSMFVVATEFLFPAAHAGISGLDPVTGATVELIRIDDDGNQIGDVLASTTTSSTGEYSLQLPEGVSLAGNLIVRITGADPSNTMSAMVVDQIVDINPISEYILNKFVDDEDLVLADLAPNEVVALTGKVDEFDITLDPGNITLEKILEQLDSDLGELVETEIAIIESTPAEDTSVAAAVEGSWNLVETVLGMHDTDQVPQSWGVFTFDSYIDNFTITPTDDPAEVNVQLNADSFADTETRYTTFSDASTALWHETSISNDTESFPVSIDSDGNIFFDDPLEEDLETVDIGDPVTDPDADGPDFGWRFPPGVSYLENVNNNTLLSVDAIAGVRYLTTDTNGDGINDAIDPDAKDGDEVEVIRSILLKQGENMAQEDLLGEYGVILSAQEFSSGSAPISLVESASYTADFGGNGSLDIAGDFVTLTRQPDISSQAPLQNILLELSQPQSEFVQGIPYTVGTEGQLSLAGELEGWVNADASVMSLVAVQTINADPNDPLSEVNVVVKELAIGVKLPVTQPDLSNAVFKLYPQVYGAGVNGESSIISLRKASTLTFSSDTSTAQADFTASGFMRSTDIGDIERIVDDELAVFDFTVDSLAANGEISLSYTDPQTNATMLMNGFVSEDGNMMVLRYVEDDDANASPAYYALGTVIAVRQ
jgi:hypothetical protein